MGITERLQELCDDAGMARHGAGRRLSLIANVSVKTGNKWINGQSLPTLQSILPLAKYFKINVEWFLTGEGDKYTGAKPIESHALLSDYSVQSSNCPKGVISNLRHIAKAALDGDLVQQDVELLNRIAQRLQSKSQLRAA